MAYYDTSSTRYDWDFEVKIGNPTASKPTTYPCTFIFYFYMVQSSWYKNIAWNVSFNLGGTTKTFHTTKHTAKIDLAAKTKYKMGEWTEEMDLFGYRFNASTITAKCSFTCDSPNGTPAKSKQQESKTVSIPANAKKITAASVSLQDNGNNTATITLTQGAGTAPNTVASTWCKYKFNNSSEQTISTTQTIAIPEGGTKLEVIEVATQGKLGDIAYGEKKSVNVQYYSKPQPPIDLTILPNNNNTVSITAIRGNDGINNKSTGLEIFYTIDGSKPTSESEKYTGSFSIGNDVVVYAMARTVGTYTGNNNEYYYSQPIYAFTGVTARSNPGHPTNLQIVNNANNTFYIQCQVGKDGLNNTATGVAIYYTTDGSTPSIGSSKLLTLRGSSDDIVKSSDIAIDINNVTDDLILNVKAMARTIGSISGYLYSQNNPSVDCSVEYYKRAVLDTPNIIYDNKLTKKSMLRVKHSATVYSFTRFTAYTLDLFWKDLLIGSKYYKLSNKANGNKDGKVYSQEDSIDLASYNGTSINNNGETIVVTMNKDDPIKVGIRYSILPIKNDSEVNPDYSLGGDALSDEYIIQSSGIMRVNQNNNWYEGQVWVNVGGVWKEATDVFVNVGNIWKESV